MNRFRRLFPALLAFSLMATPAMAQDKLRIATVNMQKLHGSYYRTLQLRKQLGGDQERIKEDDNKRLARIRTLVDQKDVLLKRIEDPATSDQKRKQLQGEYKIKHNENLALERERKEFITMRKLALKEKFEQLNKSIFEDIQKLVDEQSKLGNYDYVFDKSARGITTTPVLLYTKDSSDITADLIKLINKDAPEGVLEKDKPSE